MKKKLLLGLIAGVIVVSGVAAMSAYEAHVINVTAKIENALSVSPEVIEFGTVFPQEYLLKPFTVSLSSSFLADDQLRLGDVQYKIVQKPKCICVDETEIYCTLGDYAPVDYATHKCPTAEDESGTIVYPYEEMPDLCKFLSKMCIECDNDIGVPSYYVNLGEDSYCKEPDPHIASGYLVKCHPDNEECGVGDIKDCWNVDLKVPPVTGYEGQEWPLTCAPWTVPTDGADYGCDLWIEVTGFSDLVMPPQ